MDTKQPEIDVMNKRINAPKSQKQGKKSVTKSSKEAFNELTEVPESKCYFV